MVASTRSSRAEYVQPRTPLESAITDILADVTHVAKLGVKDDFFEAGGSSTQVIEMLMTISNKYGKEIDYAQFFKEPCIHKLTELLVG